MSDMQRLFIPDDLRRKVYSDHPREIICVDARNFIQVVDTLNWLIDDYNKRHSEISYEALVAFLKAKV